MTMMAMIGDPDPDRKSTTLLGLIRRFFDRDRDSDSRWHDWWGHHPGGWFDGAGGSNWSGWGCGDGGGGWGGDGGCGDGGGCC